MGLFSFIGKVAKAGLGVVTGGVSTAILDAAGQLLKKKQQTNQMSAYDAAQLLDYTAPPAARVVTGVLPGAGVVLRTVKRAVASRTTAKRKAPKGGLDFKALSVAWRAAGKPVSWQAWIKGQRR